MPLGLNRFNVQVPDAGIMRVVSGALVYIYNTMADGSAAVTPDGEVNVGAIKSTIYSDRDGLVTQANPITADAQGLVQFYVAKAEVHIRIVTPNGIFYGIPWYDIAGSFTEISPLNPTEIQKAIDAIPISGGVVRLGPGTFSLSTGLTFPTDRPVRLIGAGPDITILDWVGMGLTPNVDCIKVRYSRSGVEDLTIKGPYVAGTGRGIAVGNATHVVRDTRFRNVLIRNTCAEAIAFLGTAELAPDFFCFLSIVENCVFRSNFQAGGTSTGMTYIGAACTTITFRNCTFDTFKGSALSIFSGLAGGGFLLESCNIEQPADDAQHWVLLSGVHWCTIRDCWFENSTAFIGKYKIATLGGCLGIKIQDCHHSSKTELTPLCIAIGIANFGSHIDKGTHILNFWVNLNNDNPVGATILQFGSANETPQSHVLDGGGIRNNGAGTYFTFAAYKTETAGVLTVRVPT